MLCSSNTCAFGRTCVPNSGLQPAKFAIIGEAPGEREIHAMAPFVGPAGKLLDKYLTMAGISRLDVRLLNTVRCVDLTRERRAPLPAEIDMCHPELLHDLAVTKPSVIILMGNIALNHFFPGYRIGRVRGKLRSWQGIPVIPTYHPAATFGFRDPKGVIAPMIVEDLAKANALS